MTTYLIILGNLLALTALGYYKKKIITGRLGIVLSSIVFLVMMFHKGYIALLDPVYIPIDNWWIEKGEDGGIMFWALFTLGNIFLFVLTWLSCALAECIVDDLVDRDTRILVSNSVFSTGIIIMIINTLFSIGFLYV